MTIIAGIDPGMADLLSARLETATLDELPGLLSDLARHHVEPDWPETRWAIFGRLLDINTPESLFAAAMMLVPENMGFILPFEGEARLFDKETGLIRQPLAKACDTFAAALASAIAKANGV